MADRKAHRGRSRSGPCARTARSTGSWTGPRPRFQSRLEPLHDVVDDSGAGVGHGATDPETSAAWRRSWRSTHRQLHELLKPDETAEGRAFAIARQDDPAANQNAQSIVIHSLHRTGRPGIDQAHAQPIPNTTTTDLDRASTAAPAPEYRQMTFGHIRSFTEAPEPGRRCSLLGGRWAAHPGTATPVVPKAVRPGPAGRGQDRGLADCQVRRHHQGRPASTSSTTTAPSVTSSCPRPWAQASRFSTMTATATRTFFSSIPRPGPATMAKPDAHAGPLSQRRQGAL